MAYETIVEDGIDILVVGAGLGGTGAAWEARFWGQDKKIVIAEKANIDRSGAVAQGLYAINCYMGTRWGENKPEDHVRYARIDLMGMVREDLLYRRSGLDVFYREAGNRRSSSGHRFFDMTGTLS